MLTPPASAQSAVPLGALSFAEFDRRARAGHALCIVFFGASLTWGANASDPNLTSYRGEMARRFLQAYPRARFTFRDAAIGGTGSQLAVFRLNRDVLAHKPDLVFLDFTANDNICAADEETLASYESVVRRIITDGHALVVEVFFPFKGDATRGTLDGMPRRDAHLRIAEAYGAGVGDAVLLAQERLRTGTNADLLWPFDSAHPDDPGYALFADASWQGCQNAVQNQRVCAVPSRMLHADTYLTHARIPLSALGPLPAGWQAGQAHRTSAYYDMLMSRWLDEETIASGPDAAPLRLRFRGTMALLFGESTPQSGRYAVSVDGGPTQEYDAGVPGVKSRGNTRLWQTLTSGLDPQQEHTLEIVPKLERGQELRLESLCVAGPGAGARREGIAQ